MNCRYCHSDIPEGRLEFLIEYNKIITCVSCSNEQRAVGYMDWGHKTAPSLVMVPANATETIRKLNRANRRAR
jgi:uncharacterized protein YaiE (UPF0345 family)